MGKTEQNDPIDWEGYWKSQPSDEELRQADIKLSETETDQSFYDWIDQMIEEVLTEE